MTPLGKKLKQFNQAGMAGVKRATEAENKPVHYIPGDSSSFTNNVRSRTFNPVSSGGGSYVPTATTPTTSASSNSYNYPTAQTSQPFNSKWSDELSAMYEQIKNKPKFSYDQSKDPLYQQYAAMYQKNAQLAMNDTMARASALTGGYGNSYAQTAGQQMYNQQMDQLNDKALDLYYAALDKYNSENDDMYKKFNLAGQMYDLDYNAWRDQMADSRWAQEFDYGAYRDSISDRRYDDETVYNRGIDARDYNYQLSRDAVADARYADETAYNRNVDWRNFLYQAGRDQIADDRYTDETEYARQQADLDRALQYYQAGYDPKTRGMSAEARQQYRDELALNYAKLGMNPDGSLNAIGKQNDWESQYKALAAKQQIYDGKTSRADLFIEKKGRIGNNANPDGILTEDQFNRTISEGHEAHVVGKDSKGKVKGKGYTNYIEYVDAWLDTQPQLDEKEKDYLFYYYTQR